MTFLMVCQNLKVEVQASYRSKKFSLCKQAVVLSVFIYDVLVKLSKSFLFNLKLLDDKTIHKKTLDQFIFVCPKLFCQRIGKFSILII